MGFIPKMNKQPLRTVTIPELSGGMNQRDGASMIQDNQLTDCKNMWYEDGILKTRPGIRGVTIFSKFTPGEESSAKSVPCDVSKVISGVKYTLSVYITAGTDVTTRNINFQYISNSGSGYYIQQLPSIADVDCDKCIVYEFENVLYCLFGASNGMGDISIYKYLDGAASWTELSQSDIYAPLVMTHCKTNASLPMSNDEIESAGGCMFEGYNLLGNSYRMVWSTVNKSILSSQYPSHHMMYFLLHDTRVFQGRTVTAKITNSSGIFTHTVTINGNGWSYEENFGGDGLKMGVWGRTLRFSDENNSTAVIGEADFIEDNMEITAPCPNPDENYHKVADMSFATWFGGAAKGIWDGTRVFLGGNTNPGEKSLVLWSDLNRPLYFPENGYAYVGDSSQAVTAFGKQSNLLVIYKEKETYATQYVQGETYTASDIIDQNVIDVTTASAKFPMTLIHSEIGCDCPNTVRLCRNRLVWACSTGKVYTLCTVNQYSERNIYEVSGMIERKLKSEGSSSLKSACSCDLKGRYILFVSNHAYAMDYNSYGYAYAYSFSKEEDSNIKIPWFYWELPFAPYAVCSNEDNVYLRRTKVVTISDASYHFSEVYIVDCNRKFDTIVNYKDNAIVHDDETYPETDGYETHNIQSSLQTKLFDFGTPSKNKNVPLVDIALGDSGGNSVTVSFLTEEGSGFETETIRTDTSGAEVYSSEYIKNYSIRPSLRFVNRFGIKIECDGGMAVDGISLNYRLLGGTK